MVDAGRLREELRQMRSLIRDDPQVRAQFDKDGNGDIDGQEWEEVRQLVIRRLEREEQEATERARLERQVQQDAQSKPTEIDSDSPVTGAVAREILDEDLAPRAARSGASIAELRDVVLQQEGGFKQLFGSTFRREYTIRSLDGFLSGGNRLRIQLREGEANRPLALGVLAAALLVDLDREDDQDNGPSSFLKA